MNIVFLGPQGSGKGTQAKLLSQLLGVPHISAGDLLRALPETTEFGKRVHKLLNEGKLVPDEDVVKIVEERIKQADCRNGFILDGFPRTMKQARMLKAKIDRVIYLDISDAEAVRRLSGRRQCKSCGRIYGIDVPPKRAGVCDVCGGELYQRDDDKPAAILKRLETFHKESEPLKEFYKKLGLLRVVDATGRVEEIFERVKAATGTR